MVWSINLLRKKMPELRNAVLIEGLPGIGNVGKVAADFLIDELKAVKIMEFLSYSMPHSVFVNEKNLVELPSIELYLKRMKKRDILILTGDIQPIDEESSYEFSEKILDIMQEVKGKEIITLGGIGLAEEPNTPKIFCTGTSKKIIREYKEKTSINDKIYGVVGPIVGVSGLLLGLAKRRKMEAITLLSETYGHPMYLGIKGSREILKVLNKKLQLKINIKELDKEIEDIEMEVMKKTKDLSSISKRTRLRKLSKFEDSSYIG